MFVRGSSENDPLTQVNNCIVFHGVSFLRKIGVLSTPGYAAFNLHHQDSALAPPCFPTETCSRKTCSLWTICRRQRRYGVARTLVAGFPHGVIKKELRRRSAIEAVIGHLKADGHMDRNFLKCRDGDHANAVLTATGYNLRLVLKWLRTLLRRFLEAIRATSCATSAVNPAS